MKHHTQIYFDAFGYDKGDPTTFIPSEISGEKAVDLHHIVTRENRIENLMYLTRQEHQDFGEIKEAMVCLLKIHRRRLQLANIPFDNNWFEKYIKQYSVYET
ncbi:hypothetical protein [Thalassobellus suaedae]|uniref:HNH nuclease domain-containing protein n=1 Tax=Thalassobellus suaedae TaxID=3074124 RepID=A0ABY9XW34_9FLAO|nr:hypothetical protein RHP51_05045 [Flavobacteriaceae bacterium HL-DH14]